MYILKKMPRGSNHAEHYKLLLLLLLLHIKALLLLLAADIMKAPPAEPAFIIHEAYSYDGRPETICSMLNTQIILQIYIFRAADHLQLESLERFVNEFT
jgi:hypothetical protein